MNDKDWRHLKMSIKKVKYFIEVKMTITYYSCFVIRARGKYIKLCKKQKSPLTVTKEVFVLAPCILMN